jgi:hypothetical protein
MRRVVIAAATAALLGVAAGCGDSEDPDTSEDPAAAEQENAGEDTVTSSVDEQWESSGELDHMPAAASAELEPPVDTQSIVDVFTEAGLSDGAVTELGAETESCDLTDCVRIFTVGEVTVMQYMSDTLAVDAAASLDDAHAHRSVVLDYAAGETPEDVREDYQTALAEALAE